jgi:signal peptidase
VSEATAAPPLADLVDTAAPPSQAKKQASRVPAHRVRARPQSTAGVFWQTVETVMAVVAVVIGTVAVVLAVASHFGAEGKYTVFGHPMLIVVSGSMSPTIRTGDLIYEDAVSKADASHLELGQIITVHSPPGSSETFTHRIHAVVRVHGQLEYQTKGDANPTPDVSLVPPGQVIGLYRGKVPYGGYVLNSLHKPVTLALILLSPVLWFLSNFFFQMAREADGEEGGRGRHARRKPASA